MTTNCVCRTTQVLKVRAVVFDFGVLTRAVEHAEATAEGFLSGFDPRHRRFKAFAQGAGPVHGASAWVTDLDSSALQSALEARGLEGSGSDDERRARLLGNVERENRSWVLGLLAREQRSQLRDMGLEPHGKPRQLQARLEEALLQGHGAPPNFDRSPSTSQTAVPSSAADAAQAAALVAKTLNLEINVSPVAGGTGFQIETVSKDSRHGGEAEDNLAAQILLGRGAIPAPAKAKAAFVDSTPVGLPKELTDVATKYRAALMKKTGGNFQSLKLSLEQVKGDAEALSFGRSNLLHSEASAARSGSRWMLGSGVGGLLEYLDRRSMTLLLLPESSTPFSDLTTFQQQAPASVQAGLVTFHPERIAKHLAEAEKALGAKRTTPVVAVPATTGGFWGSLFGSHKQSAQQVIEQQNQVKLSVEVWKRCLEDFAREAGVEKQQLVVVSDKDDLLRAARDTQCHTIAFNPPNQRRVDASTDAVVVGMAEVKDTIELMNGISFR